MTTTIESDLKEVLGEIKQQLNDIQKDVTDLKINVAVIKTDVNTLKEDTKDLKYAQRSQIWALIGILASGVIAAIIRFLITALPNP